MTTSKKPWSPGEKSLAWIIGLGLLFCLIGAVVSNRADVPPVVQIPPKPILPVNGETTLRQAAALIQNDTAISYAINETHDAAHPGTDALDRYYPPAEKAAIVAQNAQALALLRQAIRQPFSDTHPRSLMTTYPEYSRYRQMGRLLALESRGQENRRDWNGAFSTHLDAIAMGEKIPRDGPLIAMLVGEACQAIGRNRTPIVLGHLTAPQCRQQAERLEAITADHVPYRDVLLEESRLGQAGLMDVFRTPDWRSKLMRWYIGNGAGQDSLLRHPELMLATKRGILGDFQRYYDQSIASAQQPYAHRTPPTPANPLLISLAPVLTSGYFRETAGRTQNALLLTMLALRAYQLERGAAPESLEALTPSILKSIPADPFTGGPLHYQKTAKGYLLYSVGPDGKDDGGKPIFNPAYHAPTKAGQRDSRDRVEENSVGDIVAGVNF